MNTNRLITMHSDVRAKPFNIYGNYNSYGAISLDFYNKMGGSLRGKRCYSFHNNFKCDIYTEYLDLC